MRNEIISMGLTEARSSLGKIVKKTYMDNSTIILEKGGLPIAALVSIHDLEKIRNYDSDTEMVGLAGFHSESFVEDDEDYTKW